MIVEMDISLMKIHYNAILVIYHVRLVMELEIRNAIHVQETSIWKMEFVRQLAVVRITKTKI